MARVGPGMTQPTQKANAGDNLQLGNRKTKIDTLSHACIQRTQISLPQRQRHTASAPAYVCIFSFFHLFPTFSQNWTKLDKIEQNWAKLGKIGISLFCFPSFIFKLILTTSGKIGVILGTIETNWELFGQNWANLRQIGGFLGRIRQIWEKLGGFWVELGKFEKNWGAFG